MEPATQSRSSAALRIAIDARHVREKPSGIGTYVQALVDRLPHLGPDDHFLFWAHRLASRPLSPAANTSEVTVRPQPASPWSLLWPQRYASFNDVDVFHSPHNMMPRRVPCASVVTVHDVMAIEEPGMDLQGLERVVKSVYYPQAIWRALREATCLIAPSRATADRICLLAPEAAPRLTVIPEAADSCFRPPENPRTALARATELTGADAPYLLVVGANKPNKRHDLALAAFATAVPRPWRLVLVQRRMASRDLARLAKQLHVADRIVWLETVARKDLVTLLQAAARIDPTIGLRRIRLAGFGSDGLRLPCGGERYSTAP